MSRLTHVEEKPFRMLCMDGAGIYGLAQALMLERLCKGDPRFLEGDQVALFAGTSAGAINSLLLAKEDNPRKAVVDGKLRAVWRDARTYAPPRDPMVSMLSLAGKVGWFGEEGFKSVLQECFGEMCLSDLKHKVLVTTFNWVGDPSIPEARRKWQPKIFYNFPADELDRCARVVDVAYGAATPPGWRKVYNGISDGGVFVPNPTMNAIAKAINARFGKVTDCVRFLGEAMIEVSKEGLAYYQAVNIFDGSNWRDMIPVTRQCGPEGGHYRLYRRPAERQFGHTQAVSEDPEAGK